MAGRRGAVSLCAAGALHPSIIYVAIAIVTIARRLEGSARSALLAVVVPADDAPRERQRVPVRVAQQPRPQRPPRLSRRR